MNNPIEKVNLKVNNFQDKIVSFHQDMRNDPDFSDVTLVCKDNQQIEAHKVILATWSPFFNSVLKRNKHSHHMVYMTQLKAKNLVAIVDFIYHGEVNIYQDDLDKFLALAEELQLKCLAGFPDNAMNNAGDYEKASKEILYNNIIMKGYFLFLPYR